MRIPISKLKAILLFFASFTDPKFLGETKLMKLIYFLDFSHIKKYGTPVTYDTYVHLEHGPIPSTIKNLVDTARCDIDNSFLADTINVELQSDYNMWRIKPERDFSEEDKNLFSESELEVMSGVVKRFGDKTTSYIEKASHDEAPWRLTKNLEEIPYALAAKDADCNVSEEIINFASEIA